MSFSRGTIISSFFWKLFERIGAQLVQFIVTIILARLLLPSEYGTVALITVFIALCDVIIDGGFNTALIQKKGADNLDFSTIFYFSLLLSGLLYLILYILAPVISSLYNQAELVPIIRVISISLPFYAINSIQRAYVSKKMLFQRLFYSSFGASILAGCIGIWVAYRNWGVWALVVQNISYHFITTLIMWFTVGWRPINKFSVSRFKGLFNYGWKILGANFITSLFLNIRKLVIGKFYTTSSLAYYEKGDQLPNLIMSNIFSSVQSILLPTFSESQDNYYHVKAMMRRSTKMSCFFIYPLMVGMIVSAKPLVIFLLTEKWLPVVPFVQILCIANFFRPITISNIEAIKALGYSGITLKLEIVKKIIDVVILVISAYLGVYYIAWGCVLYNFICLFINLVPNKRILNYGVLEQVKDAVPTFLISLIMGIIILFFVYLRLSPFVTILLQFIIGVIVYLGISWLVKEDSFMYLIDIVRNGFNKYIKA